jgi:hypothetical protein
MQPVQKVSIDGLRYAVDMIDRGADRLHLDLGAVCTRPESEPIPTSLFTACFADSWSKLAAFGQELRLTDLIRRVSTLITRLDQGLRRATVGQPGGGADVIVSADLTPSPYPSLRLAVYQERGQNDLDHLFKRFVGFDLEFQKELI